MENNTQPKHHHDHHQGGEACCCTAHCEAGGTEATPAAPPAPSCSCGCSEEGEDPEPPSGEPEGVACGCGNSHQPKHKLWLYFSLSLSAVSLVLGYLDISILGVNLAWITTVLCGVPIAKQALASLLDGFQITTDLLITIALVAACAIGEIFAAAEVAFIMTIGELLEAYTLGRANKGLEKLLSYAPTTAHLLEQDRDILAKELAVGEVVLVKPGEVIPVDGVIVYGQSSVDQSAVTGESLPVDKTVDEQVFEGTLNGEGVLHVQATKVGADSTLNKMIALVKRAQSQKAASVRITDRIAKFIVPISLLTAIATGLISGDITRAVTILVVFCPCALVLATPTAIMAGIGRATRSGVLIKSGEAMETLSSVDAVVFDKTGTITAGQMQVTDILGGDSTLALAATGEQYSAHPLAKAILTRARELGIALEAPTDFRSITGQGIAYGQVVVGNLSLMEQEGVNLEGLAQVELQALQSQGKTVLIVAQQGAIVGMIALADALREAAPAAIAQTGKFATTIMATGDNEHFARLVADQVGVDEVYFGLLPHGKVQLIQDLQQQGKTVAMIGDGVNDAPALAQADVGIAMGAMGSDVAIETADVALMGDDIASVPFAYRLAKKAARTIRVNVWSSVLLSIGAVALAATGIMGPVVGALVHNLGAIVVVLNSTWLFYKKV